jgi:DNA (cytosine-5)-methyltransferase 1
MFSLQAGKQHAIANAVLTPNGGRGGVGCGAVAFQANHGGPHGRLDFESETFVACGRGGDVAATLQAAVGGNGNAGNGSEMIVAHSLRADGFDASEDGTGRGTPLIAVPIKKPHGSGGNGARRNAINGNDGDPMFALDRDSQHAVMTLAIRGRGDSHDLEYRDDGIANAVLQPGGGRGGVGVGAIAFHQNVRSEVRITDVMGALNTGGGKPGQGYPAIAFDQQNMALGGDVSGTLDQQHHGRARAVQQAMSVRRLTPVECERLQGFPDSWTDVTYRGKQAADGNRYRAIGNSMAVPCLKWLIERIQSADAASRELSEAAD